MISRLGFDASAKRVVDVHPTTMANSKSKDRLSKSEFNVLFPDEKDAKSKTEPTLLSRLG